MITFCLQAEYNVVISFTDRLIRHRRLEDLRREQRRLRIASTTVARCVSVGPTAEACQCVVNYVYVLITLTDDTRLHSNFVTSDAQTRARVALLSSALLTVILWLDGS